MEEEKGIGKPLKLGALWWQTGNFKKGFKNYFSILTTNFELDWYRKQEVRFIHYLSLLLYYHISNLIFKIIFFVVYFNIREDIEKQRK